MDFLDNCPSYANGDQSDIDGDGDGEYYGLLINLCGYYLCTCICHRLILDLLLQDKCLCVHFTSKFPMWLSFMYTSKVNLRFSTVFAF